MLRQSLVFLLLDESPHVVSEPHYSLPQLLLSHRVRPQIRELLRELVEAINEILDESDLPRVKPSQELLDEVLLHLGEAVEDLVALPAHGSEDLQALSVEVGLELLEEGSLACIVV